VFSEDHTYFPVPSLSEEKGDFQLPVVLRNFTHLRHLAIRCASFFNSYSIDAVAESFARSSSLTHLDVHAPFSVDASRAQLAALFAVTFSHIRILSLVHVNGMDRLLPHLKQAGSLRDLRLRSRFTKLDTLTHLLTTRPDFRLTLFICTMKFDAYCQKAKNLYKMQKHILRLHCHLPRLGSCKKKPIQLRDRVSVVCDDESKTKNIQGGASFMYECYELENFWG